MNDENDLFVVAIAAGPVTNYKIRVQFPWEDEANDIPYHITSTSGVSAGGRVLCVRVSGTWVVLGPIRG